MNISTLVATNSSSLYFRRFGHHINFFFCRKSGHESYSFIDPRDIDRVNVNLDTYVADMLRLVGRLMFIELCDFHFLVNNPKSMRLSVEYALLTSRLCCTAFPTSHNILTYAKECLILGAQLDEAIQCLNQVIRRFFVISLQGFY